MVDAPTTDPDFQFDGHPPVQAPAPANPLGPLERLIGGQEKAEWTGEGFNAIWRPHWSGPGFVDSRGL